MDTPIETTRRADSPATQTAADPRWQRVLQRDRSADGAFWYSVSTTGVYCRPSCPSRPANPRHVAFHASPAEAEAAGFRPCRRCRPAGPSRHAEDLARIAHACRRIEASESVPALADLAAEAGRSPAHFHRLFKAFTGLTPRVYGEAHRAARLRAGLGAGRTVTEALYEAGFNSSGRFYEQADAMLGMLPKRYRAGGADEVLHFAVGQCSLGAILVASGPRGVSAILLGEDPEQLVRSLQDRFPRARLIGGEPGYEALVAQAVGLVEAPRSGLDLPLDIRGTAFQQRVWQLLRAIPPGETRTYSELAQALGAPQAARAVAGACAANPLAVAIPCHRVVRRDGALAGYAWGIERKRALLEREQTPG